MQDFLLGGGGSRGDASRDGLACRGGSAVSMQVQKIDYEVNFVSQAFIKNRFVDIEKLIFDH